MWNNLKCFNIPLHHIWSLVGILGTYLLWGNIHRNAPFIYQSYAKFSSWLLHHQERDSPYQSEISRWCFPTINFPTFLSNATPAFAKIRVKWSAVCEGSGRYTKNSSQHHSLWVPTKNNPLQENNYVWDVYIDFLGNHLINSQTDLAPIKGSKNWVMKISWYDVSPLEIPILYN